MYKERNPFEPVISFILNLIAVLLLLPLGIYKLLKKLIVDVTKSTYSYIVKFLGYSLFVIIIVYLIKLVSKQ